MYSGSVNSDSRLTWLRTARQFVAAGASLLVLALAFPQAMLKPGPVRADAIPEFVTIRAGYAHACGITPDSELYCWGDNTYGQVGAPAGAPTTLEQVSGTDWQSVSLGNGHTCAIKTDDSLWCWGSNASGQLGSPGDDTENPREVSGARSWTSIAAGGDTTCALTTDKRLYCWGDNTFGQVGVGSYGDSYDGPQGLELGRQWYEVGTSTDHSCAIDYRQYLWCWGDNSEGQLGSEDSPLVPTESFEGIGYWHATWSNLSVASGATCSRNAVASIIMCWGANSNWRTAFARTDHSSYIPHVISDTSSADASEVSLSDSHGCGLSGVTVRCWGNDEFGAVSARYLEPTYSYGDHFTIARSSWSSYTSISSGFHFTCGTKINYSWWCWGDNSSSQLGLKPLIERITPELSITGISDKTVISAPFEVAVVAPEGVAYTPFAYGTCELASSDPFVVRPNGRSGACEIGVSVRASEQYLPASVDTLLNVSQVLLRNQSVTFKAHNLSNGVDTPIAGAKITWAAGVYSGASAVTTNAVGTAVFPTIAAGKVEFTFASGTIPGYKIGPYKLVHSTLRYPAPWTVLVNYYGSPSLNLVAPSGQGGGQFTVSVPPITCVANGMTAVGCTGKSTSLKSAGGTVRIPGWCIYYGYQSNCWGQIEVTSTYTYQGVTQTHTLHWADCVYEDGVYGALPCVSDTGLWNLEMYTFPFVEVEPTIAAIWYGETARIPVRARGSGRAGLVDVDVSLRPGTGSYVGTGCVATTNAVTDANGNAYLEVCPSKTMKWTFESGGLLSAAGISIPVILTPSAPEGVLAEGRTASAVVSWSLPTHRGPTALKTFRVSYRASGTSTWKEIRAVSASKLAATISGLKSGVTYEVRTAAVNGAGVGTWSSVVTVVIP